MGKKKSEPNKQRNHVAQESWGQNRHQVHKDRKNDYNRKDKHKNKRFDLPPVIA